MGKKIYHILGTYTLDKDSNFISMNIAEEDELLAAEKFIQHFAHAKELRHNDYISLEDCLLSIIRIEELTLDGDDWEYVIPIMGEYAISNIGSIDNVLQTLTGYNRDLPRVRQAHLYKDDKEVDLIYDYGTYHPSARKAIADCIRQGIDPYGV